MEGLVTFSTNARTQRGPFILWTFGTGVRSDVFGSLTSFHQAFCRRDRLMVLFNWRRRIGHPHSSVVSKSVGRTGHRKSCRLRLEALEDRWLPSTLTVTSLQDNNAPGTLRNVIDAAAAGDTIVFDPG